jgi:esterase/lipase superfamily enzyme
MRIFWVILFLCLAACASQGAIPERSAPPPPPPPPPSSPEPAEHPPVRAPEPVFAPADDAQRCSGDGYHCVRVIYGTNRNRAEADESGQRGYGTEPETEAETYAVAENIPQLQTSTRLETGEVIVTIPATHRRGDKIRSFSSDRRSVTDDDRARVFSFLRAPTAFADHTMFETTVADLFAESDERDAILHVHGFNVSFRAGAFRAAQLKSDTGFDGPIFYFSWPSNARLTEYFNDQVDADVSARALANFMLQIEDTLPEGGQLHVIAHSMGTRVFSQAVVLLRDSDVWQSRAEPANIGQNTPKSPNLGAVILAAGDLDSGLAREWLGPPEQLAASLTFLASRNDRAVAVSGILRNLFTRDARRRKTRIGFFKPASGPVVFPGVRVFDITFLKDGFWERFASINHSTYAQDTFSLHYISQLLNDPTADPAELARAEDPMYACTPTEPPRTLLYWAFGARKDRRACSRPYALSPLIPTEETSAPPTNTSP